MIEVNVNLSEATREEVEAFYALQGVGRAIDALAHEGRAVGVRLSMQSPSMQPEVGEVRARAAVLA